MSTEDRLYSLLDSLKNVRDSISKLKEENPELVCGYSMSIGGVLNAYRECDITFDKARGVLEKIAEAQHNSNGKEFYTFSRLWMGKHPEHDNLPMSIAYEMIVGAYADYKASFFSGMYDSYHDDMVEFLRRNG
jgi:hypothetical protein